MTALKNFFSWFAGIILLVSLLVTTALAGLGINSFTNSGLLQAYLPQTEPLLPVTLRVYAPKYVVQGDLAYCQAVSTGNSGRIVWSVHPPLRSGSVRPFGDNDSTLEFGTLEEGHFVITAVTAGPGNQSAVAQVEIENVIIKSEEELQPPPQPEPVAVQQPTHVELPVMPVLPTAAQLTLGALENVASENKVAEARMVAGTIYSVVKRLQSGLLPPSFDIPLEIEQQVKASLMERAELWFPFTVAVDQILEEYRNRGQINTAASQVPVLMEIANTLATFR